MPNQKNTIHSLVEKFQHNLNEYKNPKYSEAHVRLEFVNPFWEALGWDVLNASGYAMAFRDVIHEDEVRVGGTTKAPDYSFRIGGKRIFFMETKKPSIDLKHDPAPAFQLRRYAYSARLPVSLLTDFEEFILYDTRVKPAITDKPHVGRMLYFTFDEYADHWDEIWAIFSKEAVLRGDFQKFIENNQGKKARAEIDRDFLNDLDNWRVLLAKNIALRNPGLSERELNFAVQMTIDRLIFLRMAEDRGIESQYTLRAIQNGENLYPRLVEIYYRADERYNSGLFHFEAKDGSHPDVITPHLKMDDKILKEILAYLYYPKCPYEFSVLPVEVLGNAYEQFLGKRITLTEGHRARIEEKPEVRKAGGVYYTPQYIVDYIVRNTVGKLIEGKTPKEVSDLRICDPACGSGSFLLGAYQFLLDWHLEQYRIEFEATGQFPSSPPAKGQRARKSDPQAIYQGAGGAWYLSTTEKKRILLSNIFGVDIDANAVEVTKLSLLLKVLENENAETLHSQMKLWHERALPNLSANIKCGNSLIGPDFYERQQGSLFDENEAMRINAFDWEREFSEVFEKGGFDAVIGNPPYGALFSDPIKNYVKEKFYSYKARYDSYIYFMEKGIILLKDNGLLSYITPELWLRLDIGDNIRKLFSKQCLDKIVIHGENVFKDAVINTSTFLLCKKSQCTNIDIELGDRKWKLSYSDWISNDRLKIDYRLDSKSRRIIDKINKKSIKLEEFGSIIQGITPYDKYRGQNKEIITSRAYHFNEKKDYTCEKWLAGRDIERYMQSWSGEWLSYGDWLAAPRSPEYFTGQRLLFREIPGKNKRIQASYIEKETLYHGHSITPFKLTNTEYSAFYLLAIVNSILISWYGNLILPNFGKDVFPKLNPKDIKDLPICKINFNESTEVKKHDRIVNSVAQILDLHKKLTGAREPRTRETLQRQIDATDAQIDKLVYELYGLTEEEVRVVEGK